MTKNASSAPTAAAFRRRLLLLAILGLAAASMAGCVCFSLHFISPSHPAKRMIAEFKCRVYRIQQNYLDELDKIQCCDLPSINRTMAEGDKLLLLMDGIKHDIDVEHNQTKKELAGYYHALAVTSKLHVYATPERGMFETTEQFNKRMKAYQEQLGDANATSALAESWVAKEQDEKFTELSIEAAQWRIKMLGPFVNCLVNLQKQKFLLPELPVAIELQKPDADKFEFPMIVKTHGQQWTRYWSYSGESVGWTFWRTRSQITAQPWVQMAPKNNTASWTPTAVDVFNPITEDERHFRLDPAAAFGAVTSFQAESANAVKNLKFQQRERRVKIGFVEPVTGMQFIWADSGCYEMGCGDWDKDCRANEKPAHKVCLSSFLIGRYEVTQKQWRQIMGNNSATFQKGPDFPIETVSWSEAQQFIDALNAMSSDKHFFRLPTEAEWEYACRSLGKNEIYAGAGEVQDLAWYRDNSKKMTHKVGDKEPNGLGLGDMSGNVGEWMLDAYDSGFYNNSTLQQPLCKKDGLGLKAIRGGSWNSGAAEVRCTGRSFYYARKHGNMVGFRLVMELKR